MNYRYCPAHGGFFSTKNCPLCGHDHLVLFCVKPDSEEGAWFVDMLKLLIRYRTKDCDDAQKPTNHDGILFYANAMLEALRK